MHLFTNNILYNIERNFIGFKFSYISLIKEEYHKIHTRWVTYNNEIKQEGLGFICMQLVKEFYAKRHMKKMLNKANYMFYVFLSEILGTFLLPTHFNFKHKYYFSCNFIIIIKIRDKIIIPTIT